MAHSPATRGALLTATQLSIWRAVLLLSIGTVCGECVVQGCYVAFGPDWPRSTDHRTALRWVGFTELHGGASHSLAMCS